MHDMMSMRKVFRLGGTVLAVGAVLVMAAAARASEQAAPSATVEDIVKALEYDPESDFGRAMSDVEQNSTQWKETALFMLMARAAALEPLDAAQLARLDRPAYRSLVASPERYLCQPMRLTVNVHRVLKTNGKALGAGDLIWPIDKPVWRIHCTDAAVPYQGGVMTILSTVEPRGLGEPSKKTDDDAKVSVAGEAVYKRAPRIELACVFYKVFQAEQIKGGKSKMRAYPLAVAWQAGDVQGFNAGAETHTKYLFGGLAIALVAAVYYFIRRYVKRLSKPAPAVIYRSRRDQPDDDEDQDDQDDHEPEGDEDQPVDPLLVAAAAQYEKERQDRDAHDHR